MFPSNICRVCLRKLFISSFQIAKHHRTPLHIPILPIFSSKRALSNSISRLRKTGTHSSSQDSLLDVRYLYVHTSIGRWEDVPDGILFDVGYGDSMPDRDWSPATPTVLALHSTPGSHQTLEPVLQPFVKMGCRVIAPNFPGLGYTEGISTAFNDVFSHSTDEKAEFIRDFLVALGVESVDLVIGHGAGCYPLLRLATTAETKHLFKSAVMISPWPHREFRGIKPTNLHARINFLWDRPFLRFMCRLLSIPARQTLKLKGGSYRDIITTCRTVATVGFDETAGSLIAAEVLASQIVSLYSAEDPFVETQIYEEFHDLLGISEGHMTCVDEEGKIRKKADVEDYPRSFRFDVGGQHLHVMYPGVINAISWDLMRTVRPNWR